MRLSRLAQLDEVCRTLQEAAEYIQENENLPLCQELVQNGIQMLEQIDDILQQHQADWKSTDPMERLEQVRAAWHTPLPPEISEQLQELRRSLREDITIQIRAVFFAELGGKWDSMDSVYWYMRNDSRFDPVVVLTPIFRALQVDGETKSEVIYEDYLTEKGIPFYNYWDYSPEQDCPELAFTCQPYESVTLPEFWAENIAKYTRLVYLPYFIPHIMHFESRTALCQMPIHTYAWRIAASSEKFARYYTKYSLCQGMNLMVTGIPKMDYVVNLKKAPCEIPQEWQGKIKGRTVILWNTWFDGNFSSWDMLEQLVPWFLEHQDYALVWRPHPMSKVVLELHYPDQYPKFKKLMDAVRDANNMVLDDKAEYGLSFVCSHAQISDFSSMMTQYLLMDKPLLWIQRPGKSLVMEEHEEQMVSHSWMESGATVADVIAFIERIGRGEDRNRMLRAEVQAQDLSMADGKAAERICETVWKDLYSEVLEYYKN